MGQKEAKPEAGEGNFGSPESLRAQRAAALNLMEDAIQAREKATRAASELAASEERYRTLFSTMTGGFALCEAVENGHREHTELRLLAANPALFRLMKRPSEDVAGRFVRDVFPMESALFERCSCVVRTTESVHIEMYAERLERWFEVRAYSSSKRQFAVVLSDVTARKRAEEALRASEERFRSLFEHAADGIFVMDRDTRFLDVSPAGCKLLGREKHELCGREIADVVVVDDKVRMASNLERLAEGVVRGEWRLFRGDRTVFVGEVVGVQLSDGRVQAILRDITERKRAEEEVASLARFPRENPSPVLRIDYSGIVSMANPAALPLLAALGSSSGVQAPPDWTAWVKTALSSGNRQVVVVQHQNRIFSFDVVPFPESMYANLYGLDITTQERTLAALRSARSGLEQHVAERTRELSEANELLERMFDNTHVLMAHLSADREILRVNRAFAEAGGNTPAFYAGANCFDHFALEHEPTFRRVALTGMPHSAFSAPSFFRRGEGDNVTLWDWSLQPVGGPNDEVAGLLLSLLDVTERIRLENAIGRIEEREHQATSQELHDTVGQQLTAVGYMVDNLEQELASHGEFIGTRIRDLRRAVSDADLQVRRISRGLHPAQLATGGLPAAIEDLASRTETLYRVDCACDCPTSADTDPVAATQLLRIAQEAVNNAVKHGKPKRISIGLENREDFVVLTVRDDGIGVPMQPQETTGLGLMIMKHRAATTGGSLSVEPATGGGTIVTCRIPRRTSQSP